jgi:hypothetical protein
MLYQVPDERRLRGRRNATVAEYRRLLKQVRGIVSSHHAQSRLDNPLESVLVLGDGFITLGELLTAGWRVPDLHFGVSFLLRNRNGVDKRFDR